MKQRINTSLSRKGMAMLLPLLLAGCSDEMREFRPDDGNRGLRLELGASIEQQSDTRADEAGFADGDRFGLFVVNYSGSDPGRLTLSDNQVNNVAISYNADSGTWQPASDIYWLDPVTPADVYGYYPFNNGLGDVECYSFEVRADQSVAGTDGEMGSYEASDLLWAKSTKAAPGKKVELRFNHIMAGVKVVLQQGSGFDGDSWSTLAKTVTVDNTVRTSTVDLTTGTVTPAGSPDRNVVMNPEADAWRAVVVPQTVAAGKTVIGITIDGKPYAFTRSDAMKYNAGKLHTFTIKIDRKGDGGDYVLSLVNEAITPWEADKSSHDFESNSYLTVHVSKAGTLKTSLDALHVDAGSVRNLKITGELTDADFNFIREKMYQLSAINLKDTRIINVTYRDYTNLDVNSGYKKGNDILPDEALRNISSLRRIILPDEIKWLGDMCFYGLTLSSTIIIPESVTVIESGAFCCTEGDFTVILPSNLERIGKNAFGDSSAIIDLNLPKTLKSIGFWAFQRARNIHGVFSLPDDLTYIGEGAFRGCGRDLDGEIVIPTGIKEISKEAFSNMGFRKPVSLIFHDGVSNIGKEAFSGLRFSAPVEFPENLVEIGEKAFSDCQFTGNVLFPASISTIGEGAFMRSSISGSVELPASLEVVAGSVDTYWGQGNGIFAYSQISQLNIPDNVEIIGPTACFGCEELRYVKIGKNVSMIGEHAFSECPGLETIVCMATTPPVIDGEAFRGIDMRHCVLEVPESSIESYRHADGWNEFPSITPHHELNISNSEISCLNKGISRTLNVRGEGAWEVSECPDWIKITPDHAASKEEIVVNVNSLSSGSGDREGRVVFRLKDSGYTTYLNVRQYDYEYQEDDEVLLQKASGKGKSIPIFIVGDGYGAESIANGEYMRRVNETVESLFSIEPYKTYRDMFSVYAAVSMSPDDGAPDILSSNESKFGIPFPLCDCPMFFELIDGLRRYVIDVSSEISENNIQNALVVMLSNYNSFNGSSYHNSDFSLACIGNSSEGYPYDNRALVQFYAGGEAFGGLANERVQHFEFLKGCTCPACNTLELYKQMKNRGLFENVTISGKSDDAPWNTFIFHPKYSSFVDMYEGGLNHLRGVWRSEPESVMSNYVPYYNTISRYAIYKHIMKRAGLTPTIEEFINNDKIEMPN